jgi:hypothetical protein
VKLSRRIRVISYGLESKRRNIRCYLICNLEEILCVLFCISYFVNVKSEKKLAKNKRFSPACLKRSKYNLKFTNTGHKVFKKHVRQYFYVLNRVNKNIFTSENFKSLLSLCC